MSQEVTPELNDRESNSSVILVQTHNEMSFSNRHFSPGDDCDSSFSSPKAFLRFCAGADLFGEKQQ